MRIAATYSFCNGRDVLEQRYPKLLEEITNVIGTIDEEQHKTKESAERTMEGQLLYSPTSLNTAFKLSFSRLSGWRPVRVKAEYSVAHYHSGYKPEAMNKGAFREMDFVKEGLGVEVQFGKYAFMVYNVCAKMTIFKNLGHINAGVEIVPMKQFVQQMSSGVSYFEQFVWDLEKRGVSNIDIPVLILGITADWERQAAQKLPEELVGSSETLIHQPAKITKRTGLQGTKPGPKVGR
jgi:hypothetical protein